MKLYMFILKDLPKNGFDSVRFELPSCKIVYKDFLLEKKGCKIIHETYSYQET